MPLQDPSAPDFLLPDLGEGLDEAELVEWCVTEGQTVEESETLARMETAKALVEVASPRGGTIRALHGKAGDIIKVGRPLVSFEGGETDKPSGNGAGERKGDRKRQVANGTHADNGSAAASKADVRPASGITKGDVFADEKGGERQSGRAGTRQAAEAEEAESRQDAGTVVGQLSEMRGLSAGPGEVLAAPAVRRLARDMNVELTEVAGTGIGGRITAGDVRAAAGADAASPPAAEARPAPVRRPPPAAPATPTADAADAAPRGLPTEATTRIPFRGVRRTIANRLRHSVDHAVHFTVMDEVDVGALDALRRRLATATGEKISLLPFVCRAVARVLAGELGWELARLNSGVDDEAEEIVQHRDVHLGIATDTRSGLMVPVIREANRPGVIEMAGRIADLAAGCRDRSIPADQLRGSTFTISNFGSYAGRFATPVINYPEAGILAVGRARQGVVVRDGLMGVGLLLPLSLTCDHRVVDGGTATMALNAIMQQLQNPESLMPTQP